MNSNLAVGTSGPHPHPCIHPTSVAQPNPNHPTQTGADPSHWWRVSRVEEHLMPVQDCTRLQPSSPPDPTTDLLRRERCVLDNCASFVAYMTARASPDIHPTDYHRHSKWFPSPLGSGLGLRRSYPWSRAHLERWCGQTSPSPALNLRASTLDAILGHAPSAGGEWRHVVPRETVLALQRLAGREGSGDARMIPWSSIMHINVILKIQLESTRNRHSNEPKLKKNNRNLNRTRCRSSPNHTLSHSHCRHLTHTTIKPSLAMQVTTSKCMRAPRRISRR